MSPGPPSVVLLDADGVVQRPAPGWAQGLEQLGGPGFVEAAFAAERAALTGQADFRMLLAEVLAGFGSAADPDLVLATWSRIEVRAEALAAVAVVRAAGTPCYLATNQQAHRGRHMRETLGVDQAFDGAFYSYELGVAKPDPAYFVAILARLGLSPDQALFVDDQPANVDGAQAAGLRAEVHRWDDGVAGLLAILRRHAIPGA